MKVLLKSHTPSISRLHTGTISIQAPAALSLHGVISFFAAILPDVSTLAFFILSLHFSQM